MKTISYSLVLLLIIFFACTKRETVPAKTNIVSSIDESSAAKTRPELLTAHAWVYKGFYFHYVDHNYKGDVQYERGASGNIINLDSTIFHFKKNGTFVELDGGYTYPGTWSFTNSADTVLVLDYTNWTDVATIVHFTSAHLNFTEPMVYRKKSYTELIASVK